MNDDAFPDLKTSDIDQDAEIALTEGLGQFFDLRLLDAMCQATGRDTLEYVAGLLAVMHGDLTGAAWTSCDRG
jgi:hypothetical protein